MHKVWITQKYENTKNMQSTQNAPECDYERSMGKCAVKTQGMYSMREKDKENICEGGLTQERMQRERAHRLHADTAELRWESWGYVMIHFSYLFFLLHYLDNP